MKILNFDIHSFDDVPKALLRETAEIIDIKTPSDLDTKLCADVVAVVCRFGTRLDGSILAKMPALKAIATITTGTDHIDTEFCLKKGIEILSLKGEHSFLSEIHATPELTWGLLLSLIRHIPPAFERAKEGYWERAPFFGHELYGKTIAILGMGRVGKIVGRYAHAFGMEILGVNDNDVSELDYPFVLCSLEKALEQGDVVSLHLPLNPSTHHFIRKEHFEIMKKSAVFINTARGALVDESALLGALRENKIAGAALDVLEDETSGSGIAKMHPLIQYASENNNLVITPHIAGMTFESMEKTNVFMANKLRDFLENGKSSKSDCV